ncbi:tRNA (N6-threonylcarbamoyladenosine(37)-N6)-meth yltransferase TrmO [Desulfonema ishimotonii]|uniref:tRNA (N6-threonylcarbamoyladenosine(37)-N6)-meth yltransferase TrmO n=2 Tax=Desulfonema ishimotonii TaxID=45657 RepID=A0A401G056_9BACT|nr:tRNA (N6-threonylcarbamoyladenosine(37)-N6)-meth yltransferase TrmO [Desulfonema ishimotonii]
MILRPVGVVRNEIREAILHSDASGIELKEKRENLKQHLQWVREMVSDLVILPEFEEMLDGIEGYSHVLVLYWAHQLPPESRDLKKVHPMGRKEIPLKGIFATCSPARPNPVLVSAAEIVERAGNLLRVRNLEALNGSPLIDIKPYVQSSHGAENPRVPEWMTQIHRDIEKAGRDQ